MRHRELLTLFPQPGEQVPRRLGGGQPCAPAPAMPATVLLPKAPKWLQVDILCDAPVGFPGAEARTRDFRHTGCSEKEEEETVQAWNLRPL